MADSTGFFGGLSSGFSDARDAALAQQKQDALESNQAKVQAQQQVSSTLSYISEVAKAAAAQGNDPKKILGAIEPLIQSASGVAQAAGMDPNYVRQAAQLITMRPAEPQDQDHTVVPIGEGASGRQYGVLNKRTGEVAPIAGQQVPPGQSVNLTGDNSVVTGIDVQGSPSSAFPSSAPSNAVPQPSVPAQVPPLSPGGNVPQQGGSFADRFAAVNDTGTVSDVGSPGATSGFAKLPAGMQPGPDAVNYAISNNITGPEFMKAIPPATRNTVQDIMDYKMDPDKLSKRMSKGETQSEYTRVMSWVHQASNGEYDAKYYKPMQAAVKEFTSGGINSPAGQITAGNTAIQHLSEMADAYQKMQAVPGLLDRIAKSNTSIASYAASQLKNTAVRGTSEGAALSAFLAARERYSAEIERFYAGAKGADAALQRTHAVLDAAYSPPEMYSALDKETGLLSGKVNALQDRWKTSQAGPRFADSMFRQSIKDFPIIQEKTAKSIMQIRALHSANPGGDSGSGNPGVVDFRTYFGTK